ncbi:clathrin adaptor, sigma subunit/coatomer, zeta subunit [Rhizoclosmatium globosum]|uniref:AP complex subunit sigma n=1 Tax=Rhizoclosmatium globosum TaxID=329046 RepID=A0A1Y2C057_9FUNG|nr:AP-3 complex subunit sigma-1 [Rhizoclosmatium sp. JEL0117]ORY40423.1 clathrin adaptor, sigma subunit/coatomer, zeta subunit [Rhizoclosmatium globosum]|eukprot:ORY40423.1 clathrin adaptor, sigma subunit/coatomer, zeta subunit [Rhizoclosmatium globosum]
MAIKATLIFNNTGKPRLMQWYQQQMDVRTQQETLKEIFRLVSNRPDSACNFLEGSALIGGNDTKIIYRHYATLYFVFVVDSSESELGILDLIQVLVEVLDKAFVNVCELDLIFRPDDVSSILSEIVSGGMVLETNLPQICDVLTAKNEINLRTR